MTLDRYSEWVTNRGSFILGDATDCALFTKNEKSNEDMDYPLFWQHIAF